jgi:ADP-heptose:LPS heptosyltransferase
MSLPFILKKKTIVPFQINYINTKVDVLNIWKEKTRNLKRFKVGIVYSGLLSSFIEKNIPIKHFESLFNLNADFVILHKKKEIEKDMDYLLTKENVHHFDIDNDIPFEDTIHLLQNLDLLVTIDTYIAHLAGILNIKTWLLLGRSEWRWSDDETSTYWYNSVELIRTVDNKPIDSLINVVHDKLTLLI